MGLSAKENKPNRDRSLRDSPLAFCSQRRASTQEALAFSFQRWASAREASAFSFRHWALTRVASAALEASLPSSASHQRVKGQTQEKRIKRGE